MKYLYDSHAHLDDERFDQDREDIIKSLKSNGISLVVNPGADIKSSRRAMELSYKYSNIFAGVGIHPRKLLIIKKRIYRKFYENGLKILKLLLSAKLVLIIITEKIIRKSR